ncbi:Adenosylmethionine decarboxylase [Heracleum sosnowskyi]|uniref:Adenosylmethionine decarboxylase n=1 Tax=Heracleum sosnowskyi TaxID=360622 RepID=A0AAD8H892_9APIA|nr:Adenosylmethionine decarboxylase [Heracleum sosnowskyi]
METKGGKKKSSSSIFYEAPLGYSIEDISFLTSCTTLIRHICSLHGSHPEILQGRGLRSLSKSQLREILGPAECTIVDSLSNELVDSYVLSESSLFVYPYKIIIRTCGTTKLLLSIPLKLELANAISLSVRSVKYTCGSFIFAGAQTFPHRSFYEEVAVLDSNFASLV